MNATDCNAQTYPASTHPRFSSKTVEITPASAHADNLFWRYEKPEMMGAKMLLLTIGRVVVIGTWRGELGEFFLAWCPLAKVRNAKNSPWQKTRAPEGRDVIFLNPGNVAIIGRTMGDIGKDYLQWMEIPSQ